MVFTKALVLKLLGGLAVCTGVTVGGVKLLGGSKTEGKGEEKKDDKQTKKPTEGTQEGGNLQPLQTSTENQQPSQPTKNPAGDGVNSVDPQPPQKPSGGEENLQTQTSPQPQQNPPESSTGGRSLETQTPSKNSSNDCTLSKVRSGSISPSQADQLIEKSHLKCDSTITNNNNGAFIGIIDGKTINVKWDGENKREGITSLDLASGAKIKYEKYAGDNNYNKNLKITIEGGDITLNGGTESSQITKLEEFETYGIDEEGSGESKKYYLSRKTKSFVGKSEALGLPDKCVIPENGSEVSCTLTVEQLKKINFDGKSSDPSVVGGNTATLKIIKTEDSEFADQKYKFTLETNYNITFGSGNKNNKIISNTNTEFKIRKEGGKLTLEKAWDVSSLAAKVGLENCTTSPNTSDNECTFKTNATINVMNDNDNIEDATISVADTKIKFLQDQPNFNQGFKFYSQADIKLSGEKKIGGTGYQGSPYEIKKIGEKWYLSKVSSK